MVEVGTDIVTYVDTEGRERPALVKGVHDDNNDILHPWLTLAVVNLDPNAIDEVKGVKSRQTVALPMIAHKVNAGPAAHWVERE